MKWNEKKSVTRTVWDSSGTGGVEKDIVQYLSIKEMLYSPNQVRSSDHIANIGIGIAMIMDYLEQNGEVSVDKREFLNQMIGQFPVEEKELTDAEFRAAHGGHNWIYVDGQCPTCDSPLIQNKRGVRCSNRGCEYTKK